MFNIKQIKDNGLKYFDMRRIHGIYGPNDGFLYDTGASFYEDVVKRKLKHRRIDYLDYIYHLQSASFRDNSAKLQQYTFFSSLIHSINDCKYQCIVSFTTTEKRMQYIIPMCECIFS